MRDIYETTMLCDKCQKETQKSTVERDGFSLRTWHCFSCGEKWYHPSDLEEYQRFMKLKERDFHVKLRSVGNSWIVSIPKEIIRFQEITATKVVNLQMDEPGKVILRFTQVRKVY